jgi:hypothetical protein
MRRHFQRQLEGVPGHCLRFYATTEQLAAQYNRLEVGPFRCLPYPVNPELKVRQRGAGRPLRVVSAGCIRAEKGSDRLQPLVEALWDEYLATGCLQLVVQVDKQDFYLTLPDGRAMPICDGAEIEGLGPQPVIAVRAPLTAGQYAELISSADIGLFLYDSDRYYTRCSGVLVEMLACGVPVIVPAGNWLSEQIAEPIADHLEGLLQQCKILKSWRVEGAAWTGAEFCNECCREASATMTVPPKSDALMAVLEPGDGWATGSYLRLSAEPLDQDGKVMHVETAIVGRRAEERPAAGLVRLQPGAAKIRLRLGNAFRGDELSVAGVTFHFVSSPAGGELPGGARGLIAASTDQVPALLADMVRHYPHYRQTAAAFAPQWVCEHHPRRTIEMLLAADESRVRSSRQAA